MRRSWAAVVPTRLGNTKVLAFLAAVLHNAQHFQVNSYCKCQAIAHLQGHSITTNGTCCVTGQITGVCVLSHCAVVLRLCVSAAPLVRPTFRRWTLVDKQICAHTLQPDTAYQQCLLA